MDSLVPPSKEEMARIAETQMQREKEEKRKQRERDRAVRRSMDLTRTSLDVHHHDDGASRSSSRSPRHGTLLDSLSCHLRKKSNSISEDHDSAPQSRHAGSVATSAIASVLNNGNAPEDGDSVLMHRAATLIQRTYRGYKTRREMKGLGLDADTRWTHALKELRFRELTRPRSPGEEDAQIATGENSSATANEAAKKSSAARSKWRKVAVIAARAAADMDDDLSSSDSESDSGSEPSTSEERRIAHQKREEAKARRRKDARVMGLQYFLEMVDQKHRYGSNLRTYHEEWKKADTKEPFFYWLDYGEGKNLDMTACPRERLDREQVRYLSREERQYYLVQVDSEGRLCWAKNGERIDTSEKFRDSIHGIVPIDDPTPAFQPKITHPDQPTLFPGDTPSTPSTTSPTSSTHPDSSPTSSSTADSQASESAREADRAAKYASPGFTDEKGYKKVTHLSASTILNTLLRKSVRKNTWIFVADTSFRLYIGIKDSGAFQHSSFVQGSRISSAGLVKIKNGRLTSLSPLSGHYRPPASNFRAFVCSLREEGVDMSRVSISKSYAVLVGLEMYVRTRQRGKRLLERAARKRDQVVHPEEAARREEDARDKSQSAEKERRFLEKQQEEEEKRAREREANNDGDGGTGTAVKVLQKLKVASVVPGLGHGAEDGDQEDACEAVTEKKAGGDERPTASGVNAIPEDAILEDPAEESTASKKPAGSDDAQNRSNDAMKAST